MLTILCAHCPPFSSILTMSLPPTRFFIPMKGSVWVGTTPAATSMPTTAIEDNCHDNEHNTRALSNSSNCPHSTSCANPMPLNDPQAKPECHFLSDNLSNNANFDIRKAFWLPPIFTRKTIPGSEDCECTVLYDYSAPYDPEVTSWVFSPKWKITVWINFWVHVRNVDLPVVAFKCPAFKFLMSNTLFLQLIVRKSFAHYW